PGTVGDGDRDHEILGLAGGKVLVGRMGRVEAVAAVGIQCEAGDRLRQVEGLAVALVDVRGHHLATKFGAILGYSLTLCLQHGRVVGAGQRHRHGVLGAIGSLHGEGIGQGGAGLELLDGGLTAVGAVGPV
ncbi:hypothetical protein RI497_01755, partial [Aeromonas veronii]